MANEIVYTGEADNDGLGNSLRQAFMLLNERHQFVLSMLSGRGAWSTGRAYKASPQREWVVQGGLAYICTTDHTSGTFATDLAAGKWLAVDVAQLLADLASTTSTQGAARIALDYLTTGSAASHVRNWFVNADVVAEMFTGVDPSGATDSTTGLSRALAYAISTNRALVLQGNYLISGPLLGYVTSASGKNMHIRVAGETTITVNPAAAAFSDIINFQTNSTNDASITGAPLAINCNSKAGRGITIRHDSATAGGRVVVDNVQILNVQDSDAYVSPDLREAAGLMVWGRYDYVDITNCVVDGVRRTETARPAKGIAVVGYQGVVNVSRCKVRNVLLPSGGTADADGIAVFPQAGANVFSAPTGQENIVDCEFREVSGRAVKSKGLYTKVVRPTVYRKTCLPIVGTVEFDFQNGGGLLEDFDVTYLTNSGTNPVSTNHDLVAFQQLCDNASMVAVADGGVVRSDFSISGGIGSVVAFAIPGDYGSAGSERSQTALRNITVEATGALYGSGGTVFARDFVDIAADRLNAIPGAEVVINIENIRGPMQAPMLGYSGLAAGGAAIPKLKFAVTNCTNTLQTTSASIAFGSKSGGPCTGVSTFRVADNNNIRNFMPTGFSFDFRYLEAGSFTLALGGSPAPVISNAPGGLGTSGTIMVNTLGKYFANTESVSWLVLNNATATPSVWFTMTGGATWGQVK